MTARDRFAVGQRVRLTEAGKRITSPKAHERVGVVVGFGREGRTVRLRWDGLKEVVSYHMDFVADEGGGL